jgi:hypothetical protein
LQDSQEQSEMLRQFLIDFISGAAAVAAFVLSMRSISGAQTKEVAPDDQLEMLLVGVVLISIVFFFRRRRGRNPAVKNELEKHPD